MTSATLKGMHVMVRKRKVLHDVEVVVCGGFWKAWGFLGTGFETVIVSEDGHVSATKALRQLRGRAAKHGAVVKDYITR